MTPQGAHFKARSRGETMHGGRLRRAKPVATVSHQSQEATMADDRPNQKGPNTKKKQKCKNCEGKGLLKKGDKVVKCQRCHGTGLR
jgi:DnaJ-class molecular chaperone